MFNISIRKLIKTTTRITINSVFLFLCLFSTSIIAQEKSQESRPNILLIITDDMRWDAMSFIQKEQGENEKKVVGYLVPDYADKPWPNDYDFVRKKQNPLWISRKINEG